MTKRIFLTILSAIILAGPARAAGGDFGLGIIVGEPTGFVGKYYLSNRNAIDGAVGWSLEKNNYMHLHGDYLFHNWDLIDVDEGSMAFYFGIGGRIVLIDDDDDRRDNDPDDHIGIRFPLGLNYLFENRMFDIFVEIVPIMDVAPDTDFDIEGALGARFYF